MQAYAAEINAFLESISQNKITPVTARDGLEPILIGLAAQQSMKENRPVSLKEFRKSFDL